MAQAARCASLHSYPRDAGAKHGRSRRSRVRKAKAKNEEDYILIGLVQDEVAELVPPHQDCTS